jgi:hypothetical protein
MTLSISYAWPPFTDREGRPLPETAMLTRGALLVPKHLPLGVLAYMDQEYRSILWPSLLPGYRRLARQFAWEDSGRVLHYRIVDVLYRGAGAPRRSSYDPSPAMLPFPRPAKPE